MPIAHAPYRAITPRLDFGWWRSFALLLAIAMASPLQAANGDDNERFPRDYVIYLDYSSSIIGPGKPNADLATMLKQMLGRPDMLGPLDTVTVLGFGDTVFSLAAAGSTWEGAINEFGIAQQGKATTNMVAVFNDIKSRVAKTPPTPVANVRAKVFLVASDFIHDGKTKGSDVCIDGARAPDPGVYTHNLQSDAAKTIDTIPTKYQTEGGEIELSIVVGLPYLVTKEPYKNPKTTALNGAWNQCFQDLTHAGVIISKLESHFSTRRIEFRADAIDKFIEDLSKQIATKLELPLEPREGFEAEVTLNPKGKFEIALPLRNVGLKARDLPGLRFFRRPDSRQPIGSLVAPKINQSVGPKEEVEFRFEIPDELTDRLFEQPSFYAQIVNDPQNQTSNTRFVEVKSPPKAVLMPPQNLIVDLVPTPNGGLGFTIPLTNEGFKARQLPGVRLFASTDGGAALSNLLPPLEDISVPPQQMRQFSFRVPDELTDSLFKQDTFVARIVNNAATPLGADAYVTVRSPSETPLELISAIWAESSTIERPIITLEVRNPGYVSLPAPHVSLWKNEEPILENLPILDGARVPPAGPNAGTSNYRLVVPQLPDTVEGDVELRINGEPRGIHLKVPKPIRVTSTTWGDPTPQNKIQFTITLANGAGFPQPVPPLELTRGGRPPITVKTPPDLKVFPGGSESITDLLDISDLAKLSDGQAIKLRTGTGQGLDIPLPLINRMRVVLDTQKQREDGLFEIKLDIANDGPFPDRILAVTTFSPDTNREIDAQENLLASASGYLKPGQSPKLTVLTNAEFFNRTDGKTPRLWVSAPLLREPIPVDISTDTALLQIAFRAWRRTDNAFLLDLTVTNPGPLANTLKAVTLQIATDEGSIASQLADPLSLKLPSEDKRRLQSGDSKPFTVALSRKQVNRLFANERLILTPEDSRHDSPGESIEIPVPFPRDALLLNGDVTLSRASPDADAVLEIQLKNNGRIPNRATAVTLYAPRLPENSVRITDLAPQWIGGDGGSATITVRIPAADLNNPLFMEPELGVFVKDRSHEADKDREPLKTTVPMFKPKTIEVTNRENALGQADINSVERRISLKITNPDPSVPVRVEALDFFKGKLDAEPFVTLDDKRLQELPIVLKPRESTTVNANFTEREWEMARALIKLFSAAPSSTNADVDKNQRSSVNTTVVGIKLDLVRFQLVSSANSHVIAKFDYEIQNTGRASIPETLIASVLAQNGEVIAENPTAGLLLPPGWSSGSILVRINREKLKGRGWEELRGRLEALNINKQSLLAPTPGFLSSLMYYAPDIARVIMLALVLIFVWMTRFWAPREQLSLGVGLAGALSAGFAFVMTVLSWLTDALTQQNTMFFMSLIFLIAYGSAYLTHKRLQQTRFMPGTVRALNNRGQSAECLQSEAKRSDFRHRVIALAIGAALFFGFLWLLQPVLHLSIKDSINTTPQSPVTANANQESPQ